MGPGPITPSEIVRAVAVGKRVVLVAVASAVVMIWKQHIDTGMVGAPGALRTGWCSILRMTPGSGSTVTTTNEGLADVQGRGRPMTAENAGEAAAEIMMENTGTGQPGIAIVTVTVTVTELTGFVIEGAKAQYVFLCKLYSDVSGCLISLTVSLCAQNVTVGRVVQCCITRFSSHNFLCCIHHYSIHLPRAIRLE